MTLDAYLSAGHATAAEIAERSGLSGASISRIRFGEQNLSSENMKAIIAASNDMVTAGGLLCPPARLSKAAA